MLSLARFALLLLIVPDSRGQAPGQPEGLLLEAEASLPGGSARVVEAAGASGGRAVTVAAEWQPLFRQPVPAEGEAFTVWVRHQHGPMLLKSAAADGAQRELRWLYARPTEWTWSNFGRYHRRELGAELLIIRNRADDRPDPLLDCVVLAADGDALPDGQRLPPATPRDDLPPAPVDLTVDWGREVGELRPEHWAVNDEQIFKPEQAADPVFQAFLASLAPRLLRIHGFGLCDAWTDRASRDWRRELIRAGLDASSGYGEARLMLNIPKPPGWLSGDGLLTATQAAEFVDLVRRLAAFLRDDLGRPPAYWELLNEQEPKWEEAGRLDDYWQLLNQLAAAIRSVDPAASVGGPASNWPADRWVDGYLAACGPTMDFLSWHAYATGSITTPNERVLARGPNLGAVAAALGQKIDAAVGARPFERFLTETHIMYTWTPFERRHANSLGAIYLARTVVHSALAGVDGVMMWHAKGNAYGLIDGANRIRPTGRLYQLARHELTGLIAAATTTDPELVEAVPVVRADGSRALLCLILADRPVRLGGRAGWGLGPRLRVHQIAGEGWTDALAPSDADGLTVPGYSLVLLVPAAD